MRPAVGYGTISSFESRRDKKKVALLLSVADVIDSERLRKAHENFPYVIRNPISNSHQFHSHLNRDASSPFGSDNLVRWIDEQRRDPGA